MKKNNFFVIIIALSLSIIMSSCMATMHTVGNGGNDTCKPGHYDAKVKRWYLFYGLLPLNKADSKDLVGDAKNYTIRTTISFGDWLIATVLSPIPIGVRTQTIRVSLGDK